MQKVTYEILYDDPLGPGANPASGKTWVQVAGGGGGGGAEVTVDANPPGPPELLDPGTLWWNTNDNTLYIWYTDDDTSQWVVASPGGGGEGGSQVLVQETTPAPVDYDEGTLWWNSDEADGVLYALYDDETEGKQWIEASPSINASDVVIKEPGGATQNINGGLTIAGQVMGQKLTANDFPFDDSSPTLNVSADTTDGNHVLATFNSGFGGLGTIDAAQIKANGSASFTGTVSTGGGDPSQNVQDGTIRLAADGNVQTRRDSTGEVFTAYQGGNGTANKKISINSDGRASFARAVGADSFIAQKDTGSKFDGSLDTYINAYTTNLGPAEFYGFYSEQKPSDGSAGIFAAAIERTGNARFAGRIVSNGSFTRDSFGGLMITSQPVNEL